MSLVFQDYCNPIICHISVNGGGGRCFRLTPCTMPQQAAYWIISLERGKRAHSHKITTFNRSKTGKIHNVFNICLEKCFTTVNSLSISWAGALNSKICIRLKMINVFLFLPWAMLRWEKFSFQLQKGLPLEELSPLPESLVFISRDMHNHGYRSTQEQGSFQTYTNI